MKSFVTIAAITVAWNCVAVSQTLEADLLKQGSSFDVGYDRGQAAASKDYAPNGWLLGGFASGFLLGPVGTGALMGLSQAGRELPPDRELLKYASEDDRFRQGFTQGYNRRAKSKALGSSLAGGLFGTAVIGFMLYHVLSQPLHIM